MRIEHQLDSRHVILEDLDAVEIEKEKLRKNLSLLDLLRPGRTEEFTVWQRLFGFARPYVPKIILCLCLAGFAAAMVAPKLWFVNVGIKPIIAPEELSKEEASSGNPLNTAWAKVSSFFRSSDEAPQEQPGEAPGDRDTAPASDQSTLETVNFDQNVAKSRLIGLIIMFLLVVIIEQVIRYFQSVMVRSVGHRIVMDIRNALFAKVMSFSLKFHNKNHSAKLISRITGDIAQFGAFFTSTSVEFIENVTTFIACITALMLVGGSDIFLFGAVVFIFFLPVQIIGRQIRRSDRLIRRSVSVIYSHLSEALSGQKVIKAFNTEGAEYDKFRDIGRQTYRKTMKSARLRSRTSPVIELMGAFVIASLLWYGGVKVIENEWQFEDFVTIGVALMYLTTTTRKLAKCNNQVAAALASADRVATMIYSEPEITDVPDAVELVEFEKEIRFHEVTYEYEPGYPVLKDIDFTVAKGLVVALVGPSGAGKSTLVDLLPRFYDAVKGSITIDGIDLRRINLNSLRSRIGIVSQETFLFSDTVRMNIAYGNPSATEEMIIDAANTANAHDFIIELENGYDTHIGERGVFLSGGQRQRIAIARAILKNPPILILDEATSALDSKSESIVQEALSRLMKGRTTFAIAHRLSTIRGADTILVFNEARLVEQGTHHELVKLGGLYARLYDLQTSWPGGAGNQLTMGSSPGQNPQAS